MKNKYFYPIFKLKAKSWIRYWLLKKTEFKGKLSEILTGFSFNLQNTLRQKFKIFEIQGNSIQDGEPSPENEVPILSAGDNGSITEKIVNKNWYSSELELGSISTTTGANEVQNSACRSKDYISVLPNKTYTISNDNNYQNVIYYYDKDKKFISVTSQTNPYTFTTPDNCYYMRNRTSAGNVQNDLTTKYQLELGTTSSPYTAHEEQTYTIPTQQPMRAIGTTRDLFVKVNGNWYERHNIYRKTFNGTEDWSMQSSVFPFRVIPGNKKYTSSWGKKLLSNYFIARSESYDTAIEEPGNSAQIGIRYTSITSLADFKTWLSTLNTNGKPLYVDYLLATPTDLPCTQTQIDILENIPSTFAGQTNVFSIDEVKAYLKIQYWESDTNG